MSRRTRRRPAHRGSGAAGAPLAPAAVLRWSMLRGDAVMILAGEIDGPDNASGRRPKLFRLEAVRAAFRRAWHAKDYAHIVEVAGEIPSDVLHEDAKLMWHNQTSTRATEPQAWR